MIKDTYLVRTQRGAADGIAHVTRMTSKIDAGIKLEDPRDISVHCANHHSISLICQIKIIDTKSTVSGSRVPSVNWRGFDSCRFEIGKTGANPVADQPIDHEEERRDSQQQKDRRPAHK